MPVNGLHRKIKIKPGIFGFIHEDLSVKEEGILIIKILSEKGEVLAESNPLCIIQDISNLHYWGDLHGQSEETLGTNSVNDYFNFARNRAYLDILSHQGNDFQITEKFWNELNALTLKYNEPGRFITVIGYEWSGNTAVGGDRNILFRQEGRSIHYRRSGHLPSGTSGSERTGRPVPLRHAGRGRLRYSGDRRGSTRNDRRGVRL